MHLIRRYPRQGSGLFLRLQCVNSMNIITLNYMVVYTYACSISVILNIRPQYINQLPPPRIWYIMSCRAASMCVFDYLTTGGKCIMLRYLATMSSADTSPIITRVLNTYTFTDSDIQDINKAVESALSPCYLDRNTHNNTLAFLQHPQVQRLFAQNKRIKKQK